MLKFHWRTYQGLVHTSTEKNACHAKEAQIAFQGSQWVCCKMPLCSCSCSFISALGELCWKDKNLVNNENKNLLKIKDCLSLKNKYKIKIKLWQSALGSMLLILLNLFSLNHGCEQQIPKKSFMLLSNICCPLTFCRGGIIKKKWERERARSSVHNSNFNTMLRGPKVRKMHDVQVEHVQSFASCKQSLTLAILVHCLASSSI